MKHGAGMEPTEFFAALFAGLPNDAGDVFVEIASGTPPTRRRFVSVPRLSEAQFEADRDQYFSPAPRKDQGSEKSDVLGSRVLWVDIDLNEGTPEGTPQSTLRPSFVVWSGHGYHLYWLLKEWCFDVERIEEANRALQADTTADACWNVNRLLRIPGTRNFRGGTPTACELRRANPDRTYRLEDVIPLAGLDDDARRKIRTGDTTGHRSRSERDWGVVRALIDAGADDQLVRLVFETQPVGDKYREEENEGRGRGDRYLNRTISKIGARRTRQQSREIEVRDDGYYVGSGRNVRRVSTFTILPRLLLMDVDGGTSAEDAILGDVAASGYTWKDVAFPRSAFTSVAKLDRETRLLAWQWLGSDSDVRILLPFLLAQLQSVGLPKTAATRVLGLHDIEGVPLFVGHSHSVGGPEADVWTGGSAPLVYMETNREHPKLDLGRGELEDLGELRSAVAGLLPHLNEPEVVWPTLGWYAATPFKPAFERRGYRFPILNVHGTRGSGKTTTIQRVMMPLLGQLEPKSYDANTTRFVILSLLGSSNAVPIAFSEFRFGAADKFLRFVLLSYDTGHDPRGRADQTTVDYPLSAPFSVDGEDLVADPAAKERIVPVTMHPAAIAEGTDAYRACADLRRLNLAALGQPYIQWGLRSLMDGVFDAELAGAVHDIAEAFSSPLPDRVRRNFTVAWAGARLYSRWLQLDRPSCAVLGRSLRGCFDVEKGRSTVLADDMVEDLVNAASGPTGRTYFTWDYDRDTRTFWFQLTPAHGWWLYQRRRQNRGVLERDAIRNQMAESSYVVGPANRNGRWMYGVELSKAREAGLDVPETLQVVTLEF